MAELYRFQFNGNIKSGMKQSEVKTRLGALFGNEAKEWDIIFNQHAIFMRDKLDYFTAKEYFESFKRVGAIGKISKDIQFSAKNDEIEEIEEIEETNELDIREQQLAQLFLRIGASLLFIFLVMDDFLQLLRIEISSWMFIIPSACLAYGGLLYAKGKAYPAYVGALLGGSLIGLPFLLLLPAKGNIPQNRSTFDWLILIVISVSFVVYGLGRLGNEAVTIAFENQSTAFRQLVLTYPNGKLADKTSILAIEEKLKSHIDAGLKYLQDNDLRQGQAERLVHLLHEDVARYFMWVNYQKQMIVKDLDRTPKYLRLNSITRRKHKIVALFKKEFKQYQIQRTDNDTAYHLNKTLFSIREAGINVSRKLKEDFPDNPLASDYWRNPKHSSIESVKSLGNGIIKITMKKGRQLAYSRKTILLSFASYPAEFGYRPKTEKQYRNYKGRRIGGTLEDYYHWGEYKVIQEHLFIPGNH